MTMMVFFLIAPNPTYMIEMQFMRFFNFNARGSKFYFHNENLIVIAISTD